MNLDKDKYKTQNATGMWIKQVSFINLISLFIMYSFSSYALCTSLIFYVIGASGYYLWFLFFRVIIYIYLFMKQS